MIRAVGFHGLPPGIISGVRLLRKFTFSGNSATLSLSKTIYEWVGADGAFDPTIAVDQGVASFTDPTTGDVQTDAFAGNIYVAWVSNDTPTAGNPLGTNFNPNRVLMVSSSDGGNTFTRLEREFGEVRALHWRPAPAIGAEHSVWQYK